MSPTTQEDDKLGFVGHWTNAWKNKHGQRVEGLPTMNDEFIDLAKSNLLR